MSNREDVLEGARLIRAFLRELIGEDWMLLDKNLAELLAGASERKKVDNQILEVIAANSRTRQWMKEFLQVKRSADGRPDEAEMKLFLSRSYSSLLGDPQPIPAARFICPIDGNFVWYQPTIGAQPVKCPTHDVDLVRADKQ